jgi:hypothetical protein
MLHLEQPQYGPQMPLFEQAIRDWDAYYNNEPFWSAMHGIDIDEVMVQAGFERAKLIHSRAFAVVEGGTPPDPAQQAAEDYGRKPAWDVLGARR